jgi:DNA-binding response OmpR family regulator
MGAPHSNRSLGSGVASPIFSRLSDERSQSWPRKTGRGNPGGVSRLLVVEEYGPLAAVMAIGLRRSGHEVERAGSVRRAWGVDGQWDLLVTDLEFADGDGVGLAERMLSAGRVTRVVFFTASGDRADVGRAQVIGPVVDKGAGLDELLRTVNDELSRVLRVRAVGAEDEAIRARESGRSGTRKRIP